MKLSTSKAKAAYHETCDAVDAAKQKYEKAGDDKSQEKVKLLKRN